jgi:putative transposase
VERWQQRRTDLVDRKPGGVAVNSLLAAELAQILAMFDEWGERDRSHRRLAHRGSYLGRFWASPSTVGRVLIESDQHFRPLPRPVRGERRPFPDWASYRPNSIWIYDTTHVTRCGAKVLIIEDLVSRKWLTHLVSFGGDQHPGPSRVHHRPRIRRAPRGRVGASRHRAGRPRRR